MEECSICGVPRNKARLFEAVSDGGILKVCEKCAEDEGLLVIKTPTEFQVQESKEEKTFRDAVRSFERRKSPVIKDEVMLKDIVEKSFVQRLPSNPIKRDDLIDNFHWLIMRARRAKKVSVEQMAREIGESEAAIKTAERGILPDGYKLVNKIEFYLGIHLRKFEVVEGKIPVKKEEEKNLKGNI